MVFAKRVAFDATGLGGAVKTMLDETKIKNILHPIVFNRNWKIDAYQNLRNLMYQGKLKAGDFDDIINEFNALHHDLVNNKIAAPRNLHDDIPSSFIVAIDAIRKKRVHAAFGFIKASPVPSQKFRTTSQMLDSYMKHYDGR
jgi:phage FluMu gp28-like protein